MIKVTFRLSENWAYESFYEECETVNEAIDLVNESIKEGWIYDDKTMISFEDVKAIEFEKIETEI